MRAQCLTFCFPKLWKPTGQIDAPAVNDLQIDVPADVVSPSFLPVKFVQSTISTEWKNNVKVQTPTVFLQTPGNSSPWEASLFTRRVLSKLSPTGSAERELDDYSVGWYVVHRSTSALQWCKWPNYVNRCSTGSTACWLNMRSRGSHKNVGGLPFQPRSYVVFLSSWGTNFPHSVVDTLTKQWLWPLSQVIFESEPK